MLPISSKRLPTISVATVRNEILELIGDPQQVGQTNYVYRRLSVDRLLKELFDISANSPHRPCDVKMMELFSDLDALVPLEEDDAQQFVETARTILRMHCATN